MEQNPTSYIPFHLSATENSLGHHLGRYRKGFISKLNIPPTHQLISLGQSLKFYII